LEDKRIAAKKKKSELDPEKLKLVENNGTWLEWTMLKPGGTVTYKSREYGKERGGQLITCIISQMNFGIKLDEAKGEEEGRGRRQG
jgi:hypothetical protein